MEPEPTEEQLQEEFDSAAEVLWAEPMMGCVADAHLADDTVIPTMQVMFAVVEAHSAGEPRKIRLVLTPDSVRALHHLIDAGESSLAAVIGRRN